MWNRDSPKKLEKKIHGKFSDIFFEIFFWNFFFELIFFLKTWLAEICKADPRVVQINEFGVYVILHVFTTIVYENEFQNPQSHLHVGFSPESSTLD
jgi:hypothetical protein